VESQFFTLLIGILSAPILFPANTFSASNLEVVFLNNKPAADLITLHTDQYFNSTFTCDELTTNNIQIGGTVNEYDIKAERDNTVMVSCVCRYSIILNFSKLI
jgi:hypothetical protein